MICSLARVFAANLLESKLTGNRGIYWQVITTKTVVEHDKVFLPHYSASSVLRRDAKEQLLKLAGQIFAIGPVLQRRRSADRPQVLAFDPAAAGQFARRQP
jgi:hypothetical protein